MMRKRLRMHTNVIRETSPNADEGLTVAQSDRRNVSAETDLSLGYVQAANGGDATPARGGSPG